MSRKLAIGVVTLLTLAAVSCQGPLRLPLLTKPASQPSQASSQPSSCPAALEVQATLNAPAGVLAVRLANGLTVVIEENHNSPVVCVQAFVKAGSLFEGKFLGTGISHLAEHLVAQGVEQAHGSANKEEKSPLEKSIGGESNAFTSMDETSYFINAASSKASECVDLIAGWMTNQKITRNDFEIQHGVVQRELAMGFDDPARQLYTLHSRNVYRDHPAGVPVIGYAAPLAAITYDDLMSYHQRMYVPENMVFVVVGDVDPQAVLSRVRQDFAVMPEGRQPQLGLPEVQPIASTRRVSASNTRLTQTMEEMGFLTIPLADQDLYALDVLSYILSNGETSRLEQAILREQKLVTAISSSSWTPAWGKGEFGISFRCASGKADAAERAIVAELKKVIAEGVSDEELARAKRQKVADFVYARQTVQSQAAQLASDYLSTGDLNFSRQYTDRIQQVTAEQIRDVAEAYFHFDEMVVTRLLPGQVAASGPATQASTQPAAATQSFKLPNGLRVVLHPTQTTDVVSFFLATEGGVLLETPDNNGIGSLMAGLSTQGAGSLTADQISDFFESAGGSIAGTCGNNTFYWQATMLSDSWAKALPIFADVVLHPTYPQKELDIARPMMLDRIGKIDEGWQGLLLKHFRADFFKDSPLAMLPIGSRKNVSSATVEQIQQYHGQILKAGSSVMAVYGNFDAAQARKQIEQIFAGMPQGQNKLPQVEPRKVLPGGEVYVYPERTRGAAVIVGTPGMTVQNIADRVPMTVLDTIISGYQMPAGWLHEELRGRQLVYVVHAINQPALVPGTFVAYAECACENATPVATTIGDDFHKAVTYPFTQAQIDEAVNTIITADLLDNQEMHSLAMQAALDELYGFGYDFRDKYIQLLRAVKPDDVTRVARKYLTGPFVMVFISSKPELVEKNRCQASCQSCAGER